MKSSDICLLAATTETFLVSFWSVQGSQTDTHTHTRARAHAHTHTHMLRLSRRRYTALAPPAPASKPLHSQRSAGRSRASRPAGGTRPLDSEAAELQIHLCFRHRCQGTVRNCFSKRRARMRRTSRSERTTSSDSSS